MHSLEDMLCKDTASLFSVSLSLSLSCLGFRGHGQPLARRPTAQGARSPGSVLPLVGDCASCAQNPFKPKPNPLTVTARPWTALGSSAAHVRIGRTGYMSEPSSHYLQHQRRSFFLSLSLYLSFFRQGCTRGVTPGRAHVHPRPLRVPTEEKCIHSILGSPP